MLIGCNTYFGHQITFWYFSDSIEEEPKSNKLKRRSIYENPVKSNTPRSESKFFF